jgi:hypothetical protein
MPICGERKTRQWRDTFDSKFAVIGNRGPENGDLGLLSDSKDHVTFQLHGGRRSWVGNICYQDNHLEVEQSFLPEGLEYQQRVGTEVQTLADNLFNNDSGEQQYAGSDIWLAVVYEMSDSPEPTLDIRWDPY